MNIEVRDDFEVDKTDNAIREAEDEYEKSGVLLDAREALRELRKKYLRRTTT